MNDLSIYGRDIYYRDMTFYGNNIEQEALLLGYNYLQKQNFTKKQSYKCISNEMISVSDKAFALLVLYNEDHVWMDNIRNGEQSDDSEDEGGSNKRKKNKRKRFCDHSSRRQQGWEFKWEKLYNTLCKKVHQHREGQRIGESLENKMTKRFQIEMAAPAIIQKDQLLMMIRRQKRNTELKLTNKLWW